MFNEGLGREEEGGASRKEAASKDPEGLRLFPCGKIDPQIFVCFACRTPRNSLAKEQCEDSL